MDAIWGLNTPITIDMQLLKPRQLILETHLLNIQHRALMFFL